MQISNPSAPGLELVGRGVTSNEGVLNSTVLADFVAMKDIILTKPGSQYVLEYFFGVSAPSSCGLKWRMNTTLGTEQNDIMQWTGLTITDTLMFQEIETIPIDKDINIATSEQNFEIFGKIGFQVLTVPWSMTIQFAQQTAKPGVTVQLTTASWIKISEIQEGLV